jgi:hypothetical protein
MRAVQPGSDEWKCLADLVLRALWEGKTFVEAKFVGFEALIED